MGSGDWRGACPSGRLGAPREHSPRLGAERISHGRRLPRVLQAGSPTPGGNRAPLRPCAGLAWHAPGRGGASRGVRTPVRLPSQSRPTSSGNARRRGRRGASSRPWGGSSGRRRGAGLPGPSLVPEWAELADQRVGDGDGDTGHQSRSSWQSPCRRGDARPCCTGAVPALRVSACTPAACSPAQVEGRRGGGPAPATHGACRPGLCPRLGRGG